MANDLTTSPNRITVVIPVLNAMHFLPRTVPTVLEAANNTAGVEVFYIDNGSTDGSYEYLKSIPTNRVQIRQLERVSISALRNFGSREGRGEFLSFIDADCSIAPSYFDEALATLSAPGVAATGFQVQVPSNPHWIEATWHYLHFVEQDGQVHYINSGNFFILRNVFEQVGGFREDLRTGEDAEIGQRVTNAGYSIWASPRVAATHLGNPKSIRDFFRRNVWHGLGMFGTVNRHQIDKPTAMMVLHLLATLGGLLVLAVGPFSVLVRVIIVLCLQLAVPCATVAYRVWHTGKANYVATGVFLYWLYYWARLQALGLVITRQTERYVK